HRAWRDHARAANSTHLISDLRSALTILVRHFKSDSPPGTILDRSRTHVGEKILRGQGAADLANQLRKSPAFADDVVVAPAGRLGDFVQVRRHKRRRRNGEDAE